MSNTQLKHLMGPQRASGFSLIEVLVAITIIAVVVLASATMFSSQQTQIQNLSQRQDLLQLKNILIEQFSKANVCSWQLKDKLVDLSAAVDSNTPSLTTIELDELRHGPDVTSALIAKKGEKIQGSTSGIFIEKIRIVEIFKTGNPNELKAQINLDIDNTKNQMPLKGTSAQLFVYVNPTDPPNAKRITNCGSQITTGSTPKQLCTLRSASTSDPHSCGTQVKCQTDEVALSGGCTNTGCSVSISAPIGTPPNGWTCGGWQDWTFGVHYNMFTSTAFVLCCK